MMFSQAALRGIGAVLIGTTALGACVGPDAPPGPLTDLSRAFDSSTDYNGPLSPAESQLRSDAQLFNETVLGGVATNAAIGAVLGALLGAASGGGWEAAGRGAAIGGVAGGIYGLIDGYRVATQAEASRRQVREVTVVADRVEAENRQLESSIQATQSVIDQTSARLAQAKSQAQGGRISQAQLNAERARAGQNVAQIDEVIAGASKRQREYAQVAQDLRKDGENTAELDRQIREGQARLSQLKRERDILASEIDSGRVG